MWRNKKSQCRDYRISGCSCSALIWYNWQERVEVELPYVQFILGETTKAVAEDCWLPNHTALCGWLCSWCTNKKCLSSSARRVATSILFRHISSFPQLEWNRKAKYTLAFIRLYLFLESSSVHLQKSFFMNA